MNRIFISYSRQDEKQVTEFVEGLRKLGFEIWQDISGKRSGIPYSVKWFEVIEEAIFTASGAIIFNTETWERSVPCQREYQLIRNTNIPFMYISVDRLMAEREVVVDEAAFWCREQIYSRENGYCKWMLSGAYRMYKGLPVEVYFPTGKHRPDKTWRWLKNCRKILSAKKFQGPWVEKLPLFLKKAKRKFLFDLGSRLLGGIFLILAWIWIMTVWEISQMGDIYNDSISIESAYASKVQRVGEYDPVQAMQMMEKYGMALEEYIQDVRDYGNETHIFHNHGDLLADCVSRGYYKLNRTLADLVSRNYPVAFYESASDCSMDILDREENKVSSRYVVTLSDVTAQVFIYDKEYDITQQLLLAAVPETYCFNESGSELVIAAANKAYVHDLSGGTQPVLLSYNYEKISKLFMYGNRIYAITENNHVVVWDNPLQERKVTGRKAASGYMAQLQDGCIMAVYVDNGSLIMNIDNKEVSYQLPFEGVIDEDNITVSPDYACAAVSYRPDGGDSDIIGVIDLSNGVLKKEYDTRSNIVGFIFSEDGDFLVTTCYDENKIKRINLETGEMQESVGETFSNPYTIIEYEHKFLVCDVKGSLTVFDDTLNPVGDYRVIGCRAPLKQLAVSQKYDRLLTAGRGGNMLYGNFMTWLSEDKRAIFVPVEGEQMVSTTSVAVTGTGEYAAFGNAGGSVYLWNVFSMDQIWNEHSIPEAIINMLFSDESSILYVLGSSGTIYEINMMGILDECVPEQPETIWQMYMKKTNEIRGNMYGSGVSMYG